MAKTSVMERNKKRNHTVARCQKAREAAIAHAKKVCNDPNASVEDRMNAWSAVEKKFPRNASKTRIRKRCEGTGRPRGNNFTGYNRLALLKMIKQCLVPGVTKSSW